MVIGLLLVQPALVAQAWDYFRNVQTKTQKYEPLIGPDDRPATTLNADTMETSVPGLFVAGGLVGGLDTGAIFIENGRFHGEVAIAAFCAATGRRSLEPLFRGRPAPTNTRRQRRHRRLRRGLRRLCRESG